MMEKDKALNLLQNGLLPQVHGAYYEALKMAINDWQPKLSKDMGEVSDGYHTFNQLYHQRAVLFACIVNQNKEKAWKSFKHSDEKYCFDSNGEWFIVGVDTPQGSYTYHYAKKYWDMFECKELECGKEWDGHTEDDVTRLLSLPSVQPEQRWIPVSERLPKSSGVYIVTREFTDGFECKDLTDACYFDGSTWYGDNRINHKREYVDKNVVAWMPLPEPWKEGE